MFYRQIIHRQRWVFLLVFLFFPVLTHAEDKPLAAKKLLIQDKESYTYGVFVNGERYQDVNLVYRVLTNEHRVNVFVGRYTLKSKFHMPDAYTNYQRKFTVSLLDASLIKGSLDNYQQFLLDKTTGVAGFTIDIDRVHNMAKYVAKIWDGYELMQTTTRIRIPPGYPIWDVLSIGFVGTRFLNVDSKGMVYGIPPNYVKDAVPIVPKKIRKKKLTTPAGTFDCLKIGIGVTDPFLAQLLESYVKELYVWIDTSPRGLVIKTMTPNETYILESIGNLKD
jgi:hypothetical protein